MSGDFKPAFEGMNFHNLDGSGWPDSVVVGNGGDIGDGTYEARDYVPWRTCSFTYDPVHDDMVCGACGCWLDMAAYAAMETAGAFRFCPGCGAKVEARGDDGQRSMGGNGNGR